MRSREHSAGSRFVRMCLAAAGLLVVPLLDSDAPAGAAVTVGQVAPATPATNCEAPVDRVQPTVSSGTSYVIPANGTITSWSTNAGGVAGELKLKVFHPVTGTTFTATAQDGPRNLTLNTLNTFTTNVAVKAGDLLGLNSFSGATSCSFEFTGDSYLRTAGTSDLENGQSSDFPSAVADRRLNISAVLEPTNTLTFGAVVRNRKKGNATLPVEVPNKGQLDFVAGTGAKVVETAATKTVTAPGTVKFKIKAKGKKRAKLNDTGKVKVRPTFTFTPTGGTPNTQSIKVKLRKKIKT
jgi:hypothetical protein